MAEGQQENLLLGYNVREAGVLGISPVTVRTGEA